MINFLGTWAQLLSPPTGVAWTTISQVVGESSVLHCLSLRVSQNITSKKLEYLPGRNILNRIFKQEDQSILAAVVGLIFNVYILWVLLPHSYYACAQRLCLYLNLLNGIWKQKMKQNTFFIIIMFISKPINSSFLFIYWGGIPQTFKSMCFTCNK